MSANLDRFRSLRFGRIGWSLLGLLGALLLLETAFRTTGWVLRAVRGAPPAGARYTILCEGDSFTYGIGGQDFPFQLERILNERAGQRLFRVVNEGLPGLNTALLADRFEEHLSKYEPQAVITVVGENNSWNTIRLSAPDGGDGFLARLDRSLLGLRVYKFLKVSWIGLKHKTFHGAAAGAADEMERTANHAQMDWSAESPLSGEEFKGKEALDRGLEHARRGEYEEGARAYREVIATDPRRANGYLGAANCLLRGNRFSEAVVLLKNALEAADPGEHESIYCQLGWAYRRKEDIPEALRWWTQGLRRYPESNAIYQAMVKTLTDKGRVWEALDIARDIPGARKNLMHRYLERLAARHGRTDMARLVRESMLEDLRRIIRLASARGVRTIFCSYPDALHPEVREAAAEAKTSFVDFTALFKRRYKDRAEYISSDSCHCNSEGYRFMAETFADELAAMFPDWPIRRAPR